MLRMEQVHVIRHKVLREGQSTRQVARELGVSRSTIGKYLREAEPIRTRRARARPVWERVKPRLDELLAEWEPRTTAKQRLTGTRLQRQLAAEGHAIGTTLIRQFTRTAAPASGSLHSADSPAGRGGAGRFLRGGGGGGRPVGQGVGVSAAPDVLGARVRLAPRALRPARLSGWPRAGLRLSGRARALAAALDEQRVGLLDPAADDGLPPPAITVPPALAGYVVETGRAADYDHLLLTAGGAHV